MMNYAFVLVFALAIAAHVFVFIEAAAAVFLSPGANLRSDGGGVGVAVNAARALGGLGGGLGAGDFVDGGEWVGGGGPDPIAGVAGPGASATNGRLR